MKCICPIFELGDEEMKVYDILFSKKSRMRLEDPKVFNLTHYPIKVLTEKGEEIKEDELCQTIYSGRKKGGKKEIGPHCSVFIGNNGVGKSELCAYLKVSLDEKGVGDAVLYIDKHETLTGIISKKIPDFFEKLVGKQMEAMKESNFVDLGKFPDVYSKKIGVEILQNIDEAYGKKLIEQFQKNQSAFDVFIRFIADALKRVFSPTKKEQSELSVDLEIFSKHKVTKDSDILWFKYFQYIGDDEKVIEILNTEFDQIIYNLTNTPSLADTFQILAHESKRRIYIIFEDYDLLPRDHKILMNFIESNDPVDIEFIIALLPNRIKKMNELQSGTFRDRNDFYNFETDTHEIPFFKEETIVEFIRPFIEYLKSDERGKALCKECNKCSDEIRPLFPFSGPYLKRIYNGLDEKRPRKYVELVSELLDEFRTENILPFKSNLLGHISANIPPHLSMKDLFKNWYGSRDNFTELEAIANAIGIEEIKPDKPQSKIEGEEETVSHISKDDQELMNLINSVRKWYISPTNPDYGDCASYIKKGATIVADNLSKKWVLANPWTEIQSPDIRYHFSSNSIDIVGEITSLDQCFVSKELMTHEIAVAFLEIGYKKYSRLDDIPSNLLYKVIGITAIAIDEWRNRNLQKYFGTNLGKRVKEVFLDDLIAMFFGLCKELADPFDTSISEEDLPKWLDIDNIPKSFSKEILGSLNNAGITFLEDKNLNLKIIMEEMFENLEEIFKWRFSIDGKIVDLNKVNRFLSSFNPWFSYQYFKLNEINNLDRNLRIGKKDKKLKLVDLLMNALKLTKELIDISEGDIFEELEVELIRGLYSDFNGVNRKKFDILMTVDSLEGTQLKAGLTMLSKIWDETNLSRFLGIIQKYEKSSDLKVRHNLQGMILESDPYYMAAFDIINHNQYIEFSKATGRKDLKSLTEYLLDANQRKKREEQKANIQSKKVLLGEIMRQIKLFNELDDFSIDKKLLSKSEEIFSNSNCNVDELQQIIIDFQALNIKYFDQQKDIYQFYLSRRNLIDNKTQTMIKNWGDLIEKCKLKNTKENIVSLIESKQSVISSFKELLSFLNEKERKNFLSGKAIIISTLSDEELIMIKKSKISNSTYIFLKGGIEES